jgi:DNA helicase-2/ATP-dependent DNA helicase PcrA
MTDLSGLGHGSDPDPASWAGPEGLGRSLVVAPGEPVPEPWSDAPEVEAAATARPDLVERLHRAWRTRERLVIRWSGPLPEPDPVLGAPFHELGPTTELAGERLRFAVMANSVVHLDGRTDLEPVALAMALGGSPTPAHRTGDVTLPDGTAVWVDGGPADVPGPLLGSPDPSIPVVPRVHLVARRLVPVVPVPPAPSAPLADDQLDAVTHGGGPARIIAPAGSGKTRVLTERTRHLVRDRGLHPSAVSLVAYNRRARAEMADRLADVEGLNIRTLNSLALAIATGTGPFAGAGRPPATTISELDARRRLERLVPGRQRRANSDPLEPWIDALSACRLGLRDPNEIEAIYGNEINGFAEVIDRYRSELRRQGELDYDEQILTAIEVLLTDPAARTTARRVAPILLVDEFQDLTPAHVLLVRLLAGPAGELFAVGDDDQTIYGYSGASPDWLVHFERFFPGAADHRLTINYRCPPTVIDAARNLLTHNRNRVVKSISASPGRVAEPDELRIGGGNDPQRSLVEHVDHLVAAGAVPSDIAVLARVNAALLPALIHLDQAGHPVAKPPGVDTHLLDRSGTGAALAWLRLATAPEQGLAGADLRAAMRRPPRSLHPRIADWVCEQRSVKHLVALSERLNKERDAAIVASLATDVAQLRLLADKGAAASELLDTVYHDIGLLGAASQLDRSQRTARRPAHSDELLALRAVADLAPRPDELESWLRDRLDRLPRFSDRRPQPDAADRDGDRSSSGDRSGDGGEPTVTLATIHTTKGLEWPHVIVHDVRRDLYPHSLAGDLEEERRIFHVGLTRGRRTVLVNTSARGPAGSPFLAELDRARPADRPWPEPGPARPVASDGRKRPAAGSAGGRSGARAERAEPSDATEAALRQALTAWRTDRCRADKVPAYVVLDNATLDAIAASTPATLAELGRVKGIGPTKLDRYGADILAIVADTTGG